VNLKKYTYSKQELDRNDINAVIKTLNGELITQGNKIKNFEKSLSSKFGSKYCIAVSSGTAALHLAGFALNWQEGDIILTSPITFLASSNAALYHKCTPEFVDIEDQTYTIDCNKLEDKIKQIKKRNKVVKSVIGVDYAGHPCDWNSLKYLSNKYEFTLINDNCHSIGSKYNNLSSYASKYADIVTQSYHAVKNITTGEGGAVLTNNKKFEKKIKLLRSHGVSKSSDLSKKFGRWYYSMEELGYNYRLTDFQAALGTSQLKKLDNIILKKNKIASYYNSIFAKYDQFKTPVTKKNCLHSYHLYPLQFEFKKKKINKKNFFNYLAKKNIFLQVHYIPIYKQPYYKKKFNYKINSFPVSESFYNNSFSLPIYKSLLKNDLDYITKTILKYTI